MFGASLSHIPDLIATALPTTFEPETARLSACQALGHLLPLRREKTQTWCAAVGRRAQSVAVAPRGLALRPGAAFTS
jgi:hypothetical protein